MLKRQLYTVYILALFIPLLAVGSYLLYNNYTMIYDHHESALTSDNIRVRSIMFELSTSVTNICDSISESKDMISFLAKRYATIDESKEAISELSVLKDFFVRHTETSSIVLYTNHPDLFTYDQIEVINKDNEKWYNEQLSNPGYHWSAITKTNNLGVEYIELQLVHLINIPNSEYDGVLVISVSSNYLKNRIDNNNLEVDLMVNNFPIFFSTWGNIGKETDFKNYSSEPFFFYSGTEQYIEGSGLLDISTIQPIKSDDSIYVFSSDPLAVGKIKNIQMWTLLIIGISLGMPTLVIIKYTKELTNRVDTLRTEMHRVTSGDYNIIETFKGNDELVDLFKDLKVMIQSINDRDKEIFNGKLKEQELISHHKTMEMEILSSKINPHFLYNTLETIRMKAFSTDDFEVARAVKILGKYMRYNLESSGEPTSLKDELAFISLYLDIQSLRFQQRIVSNIYFDQQIEAQDINILPLLIQPIVENAYIHAHKETIENGKIDIRIKNLDDTVLIIVEDNGTGINKEQLDAIYTKINQAESSRVSIGLQNIHQRLKLYYGEDFGLHIETIVDQGTKISFTIPKK